MEYSIAELARLHDVHPHMIVDMLAADLISTAMHTIVIFVTTYVEQPKELDFVSSKSGPEVGTEDCPICLDSITKDQVTTHCGHTFHLACLKENFVHSTLCPLCRHQFEPKPLSTSE